MQSQVNVNLGKRLFDLLASLDPASLGRKLLLGLGSGLLVGIVDALLLLLLVLVLMLMLVLLLLLLLRSQLQTIGNGLLVRYESRGKGDTL